MVNLLNRITHYGIITGIAVTTVGVIHRDLEYILGGAGLSYSFYLLNKIDNDYERFQCNYRRDIDKR